jgi:hypothetical protein
VATIQDAIEWVQLQARSLVAQAPDYPEESTVLPVSLAYAISGEFEKTGDADVFAFHTITVEIHEPRKSVPYAVRNLMRYVEAFPALILADPSLGSNVSTFVNITYTLEPRALGDVETLALIFNIERVKILTTG